jgi:type VI secretion system ImpA/VasJ family protein
MTTLDEIRSRAAPLLEPIAGAEPGGQNASFDPRYESVRNELAKLDSPTGGEIDWKMIGRSCDELLRGVTKDFLLASHQSYAMLQLDRWRGLATGLALITGMLETWWEQGFPPVARLRARGNALDWLVARLEIALPTLGVRPDEVQAFELVRTQWSALGQAARARLADNSPAMGGVAEALERLRMAVPADAAAPSPAGTTTPADQPVAAEPASAEPAAVATAAVAPEPAPPPGSDNAAPSTPGEPLAIASAQAAKWLQPIPGVNPAGVEARYDPGFEVARLEIAKLESVTDNAVDWKLVHDNASAILIDKSKDLLMGTYLAYAKLRQRGLGDAVVGLQVVSGLIDGFWEGLQPERLRGRANALGWYVAQLELALAEIKLEPRMRGEVLQLELAVQRLAGLSRDRFEADGPSLGSVLERIKRMLLAVPEEKPAAPPPPPAPTPTASAAPSTPPPSTTAPVPSVAAVDNPEAVGTFLQETGRALLGAGNLLRQASNANPTAYRLVRTGLYLHLVAPPPADAGGKTQIPVLPPPRRQQLAALEQNGKWDALIEESEAALQQFRFCLDLHRFTHRALERLGDGHTAARAVVASELAAVLARMPGLVDLLARDGTPLTEPDTRSWIAEMVQTGSGGPASSGASDSGTSGEDAKVFAEARALITANKPADALRIAQVRIDAATTARQRFTRRLALAHMLLDANQALLARGLFAALERELREHALQEWEPELTARCLEGFVRAIRAAAKAGARYDDADRVYERLCLVDPMAAARLAT